MLSLLTAVVLLPMVGLAVDGSVLYLIKAKLSKAVDAAALAGARSLSVGMDINSQTDSASATARSFFYANFPNGYWNTSNLTLTGRDVVLISPISPSVTWLENPGR